MKTAKMSPQKKKKKKKKQIKTYPDNATDNTLKYGKYYLKCDAISNTIILFATLRLTSVLLYLGIISSAFSLNNLKPFLIRK